MLYFFLDANKYFWHKCGRKYRSKTALSHHIRVECGKEPRCFCPFSGCGYRCKVKWNLKMHIKAKHKVDISLAKKQPEVELLGL